MRPCSDCGNELPAHAHGNRKRCWQCSSKLQKRNAAKRSRDYRTRQHEQKHRSVDEGTISVTCHFVQVA